MAIRDVVVIGASAGGIEPLQVIVRGLPKSFPATICVVSHVAPTTPSVLPKILARAGKLPAAHARDGDKLAPGTIFVAPPDRHLRLSDGALTLDRAAKENGYRPCIDVLFRSAAAAYGPRVIGLVLSGALDDGTAGLLAVKRRGGLTLVQDPATALYPSMPLSALELVNPDKVLPVEEIAGYLVTVAGKLAPDLKKEPVLKEHVSPAPLVCPDCGGVMVEAVEGSTVQFRCHTGHAYSPDSLLVGQAEAVERALWSAVRALEESAALARRLEDRAREAKHDARAERYGEKRTNLETHAGLLRELLQRQAS